MTDKKMIPEVLQKIFNASKEELKEWESYGDSIQEQDVFREVMEEQVVEALQNTTDVKIPILHVGSPIALSYRRAASSTCQCEYQDSIHYQFIEDGQVKIQVRLSDSRPIAHVEICLVNQKGNKEIIPVESIQDEEELFINCGSLEELRQKMTQIQRKLEIVVDEPIDMALEIYRKE